MKLTPFTLPQLPSPTTEKVRWSVADDAGVEVWVRRLDQISGPAPGNKTWKTMFGGGNNKTKTTNYNFEGIPTILNGSLKFCMEVLHGSFEWKFCTEVFNGRFVWEF